MAILIRAVKIAATAVALALALAGSLTTSHAQNQIIELTTVSPVAPPAGFGVQDTATVGGTYPFNTATSAAANWYLVAWSNPPGESYLLPFTETDTSTDKTWTASSSPTATQSLAVTIDQNLQTNVTTETLTQTGIPSATYCTSAGSPLEEDFFVAANSHLTNPSYPSAYARDGSSPPANPPLNQLGAMIVNASVTLVAQSATATPGPCVVNQSTMLYAVVLNNTVSNQTLFYQLAFNFFCYPGTDATFNAYCAATVPSLNYFFTGAGGQWGIDDYINNYTNAATGAAYSLLQTPGTMAVDIDLLPHITAQIKSGQYGLDTNLAHWTWGSFYYGQHTWGSAVMTSRW